MSEKEEPETINVKDLQNEIKELKEMITNMQKSPQPRGITEGLGGTPESNIDVHKKMLDSFREFLETGQKGDSWVAEEKFQETIGAVSAGSAKPSIWSASPELLSPAGAVGYFLGGIVKWKDDVKGKPGQLVYVQTIGPVATADITSGTEPTFTASEILSVPVTLTQKGHGFYVTKADLEDMQDGTMEEMLAQSKNAIMRAVDAYMLQRIQADDGNAAAGTITEAGAMAATVLAKMWGSLTAGSYVPAACVMHPVPYASLLQDEAFTNASKRGDSVVNRTGNIDTWIGVDVVPLVQGTLIYGGGTYRSFMMAKGALVGAIKRDLGFEKEYYVKDQREYTVASIRFGGTVVHTSGIGLILTVES
jgi:hypothetical protein